MKNRITISDFNQYREQINEMMAKAQEDFAFHKDDKKYHSSYTDICIELQNALLSYDLSNIPYEAWDDFTIFSDVVHRADFSKTKAKLIILKIPGAIGFIKAPCPIKCLSFQHHCKSTKFGLLFQRIIQRHIHACSIFHVLFRQIESDILKLISNGIILYSANCPYTFILIKSHSQPEQGIRRKSGVIIKIKDIHIFRQIFTSFIIPT